VLAFIGLVAALVQGGIMRPLSGRVDDAVLIRTGAIVQASAFAGLVVAGALHTRWMLYGAGAWLAVGNGLTSPSVPAFISRRTPPDGQGAALGTNQSVASLARAFGPAMGGFLYANVGSKSPYVAACVGMSLAFLMAMGLRKGTPPAVTSIVEVVGSAPS
jgi:MFS family permease